MSQGGDGRTRIFLLCAKLGTKAIDGVVEVILFLTGRALECSKPVAEFLNGFLEIRYLFR